MKKNFLFKGVSILGAVLLLANVALPGLAYADEPTDPGTNSSGGGGGGGSSKPATVVDCANVTTSDNFSACIAQGGEITIGNDIDFGTNARYEISSPVTINGGNYTFTDKIALSGSYSLLQFLPGSEGSKIENLNFEITTENKVYDAAAIFFAEGFGSSDIKTEINNISVKGEGDGNRVIGIDSAYNVEGNIKITQSNFENIMYGMYFNGIQNVEISDNTINGTNYNAINFASAPKNITIKDNTFENISNLENNTYGDQYSAGIYLGNGAENIEIEGNTIIMAYGDRHSIFIKEDNLLPISSGTFSDDVSDYTADGKCSIKNDDGKYEVKDCPKASETFVTSKGTELPIVYDENKTIKLAETQALFKKKPIPSDRQDAAILNAIKTAEELTGTEIVEIEGEDVLFFDVSVAIPSTKQTKAFRGSGSSLFESTSFKVNNPNKDASNITYDLSNAKYPTWVDTSEDILDYNEVKEGGNIIGYTLHTATNFGWFYAPRMYKVTFNSNGGTEYEAQIVALVDGKATNPGIPTKEGSGFKFWSLSNGENATEYDFSAEVTDDITLYAIYGDDAFTVTWKNGNDIINTGVFASGAMPAYVGDAPSKDADSTCNTYEFKEWTPSVTAVTDEATYTATFTCTSPKSSKSSGGGGGGGSSKVTNTEDTKATTGDTAKVDENNTEENNEEKASDENKDEEKAPMTDAQAVEKFGQEQIDAYKWALENGITTMKTVEAARLDQPLTRAELAKMMVVYIQKVLEKDPIVTGDVSYPDVDESLGDLYGYIKLAYQYQIMGINADGTPIEFFNPNGLVTRGEYATVFSRVLFGDKFNKDGADFYAKHLEALKAAGILTNTIPTIQEMRGWVMLMMYRSSQNSEAIENVANTTETNEEEKADEETATASDETKSEANEEEKAEEATNTEATTGDVAETPATQESSETTAENTETTVEATTGNVAEAPTAEASTRYSI